MKKYFIIYYILRIFQSRIFQPCFLYVSFVTKQGCRPAPHAPSHIYDWFLQLFVFTLKTKAMFCFYFLF